MLAVDDLAPGPPHPQARGPQLQYGGGWTLADAASLLVTPPADVRAAAAVWLATCRRSDPRLRRASAT